MTDMRWWLEVKSKRRTIARPSSGIPSSSDPIVIPGGKTIGGATTSSSSSTTAGSCKDQPVAWNILRSNGSPISSPPTEVREWQAARHSRSLCGACDASQRGCMAVSSAGSTPMTSTPSSVRVPVLSKQRVSNCPAILTLLGEMQKIIAFLSRSSANSVPMVMAAGSAGGTAMVTMSQALRMMSRSSTLNLMNACTDHRKPATAITDITATNLKESA
mmetsp:Transcript_15195/g.36004  ORF Transcript_15195/g.36004 Transcript_15195/m.36004 type:complete len:217 (+) Transcript_15195:915-1565(+)